MIRTYRTYSTYLNDKKIYMYIRFIIKFSKLQAKVLKNNNKKGFFYAHTIN